MKDRNATSDPLKLLKPFLLSVVLMVLQTGCAYHVATPAKMTREEAVKTLNTRINWRGNVQGNNDWSGSGFDSLGAREDGFAVIKETDSQVEYYGSLRAIRVFGKPQNYSYSDITDVRANIIFLGMLGCGVFDPTGKSSVFLKMRDGKKYILEARHGNILVPFYFIRSNGSNAYHAAAAFERLRLPD